MTDVLRDLDIDGVTSDYAARGDTNARAAAAAAGTLRAAGIARLICFVVGVGLAAGLATDRLPAGLGWLLLLATVALFIGLIVWHRRVRALEQTHRALEQACQRGANRVHRRWDALPAARSINFPADHPFAGDVHLAGAHSLARLLPEMSAAGSVALRTWILAATPPSADVLYARQHIVRALAPRTDWRERLSIYAGRLNGTPESLDAFFRWAEGSAWLRPRTALLWCARALTVLTIVSFGAALAQLVPAIVVLALVVLNLLVTGAVRRELAETLGAASSRGARLRGYGSVFQHAHLALAGSPELCALDDAIGGAVSAKAFAAFDQLVACGELRLSPMGHYALQALVLWDFHVVNALEVWQRQYGRQVRQWVTALAEVEALSALATVAHENPSWTYPQFRGDADGVLEAAALAHPLLAADVRVANDLTVGPRGRILLVTGSNMAGKTTLLRAVALNVILAQAGAPVCARSLSLSRFRLRTSMRATDSLEEGLSLFMAELVRLKSIVDEAETAADCALLYLADEILRGTNAADRHAAIISVLGTLAAAGAVGVVATHDPDIAAAPSLEQRIHAVNLIEQFRANASGASEMWFDYTLREGVATTRNALKLLEMVGLDARA